VLGELGESGAIPLLRRAIYDEDVTLQAVEAMAKLGDDRAYQQLTIFTHDFRGDRRIIALNALGALRDPKGLKAIELQFTEASMIEVRLAAARALGRFGRKDGLRIALQQLDFKSPSSREGDPAANQVMRIRSMAALALGSIGDPAALPKLRARLDAQDDPRVQVAAAKAILEIVRTGPPASTESSGSVARSGS
jgi:HEAT repeat protein